MPTAFPQNDAQNGPSTSVQYPAKDLAIWCGPVTAKNLQSVTWKRPTQLAVVNEGAGGIGSSAFSRLASELGAPFVTSIARGAKWTGPGRIAVMGFSAAHGLMAHALDDGSLPLVAAWGSFDSWYGRGAERAHNAAADLAADSRLLACFTCSDSADPRVGPASKYVLPLVTRHRMARIDPKAMGLDASFRAWKRGRLFVAHGPDSKHVSHATEVAPAVAGALIAPELAHPGTSAQASGAQTLSAAALAVLGYLAWRIFR